MKIQIILLALLLAMTTRINAQVVFEKLPNWAATLQKAGKEGKFIFVEACSGKSGAGGALMDRTVFSTTSASDYVNAHFISVKVQLDTTSSDDEQTRAWYDDARHFREKLKFSPYPAYLFFEPNGQLVHAGSGVMSGAAFLTIAASARDTGRQYFRLLDHFYKHERDYQAMPDMIHTAETLKDPQAMTIAGVYLEEYVYHLPVKEQLTPGNIRLIRSYLENSGEKGMALFEKQADEIDRIMNTKGYAAALIDGIISKEMVTPVLYKNRKPLSGSPDWESLHVRIGQKFGQNNADRVILSEKIKWYLDRTDWPQLIKYTLAKTEKYGYDTTGFGKVFFNNMLYEVIFKHSDNPQELEKAIGWIREILATNPDRASWLDTYANLLYKTGRLSEALPVEEKANRIDPKNEDIRQDLAMMKRNQPTWPKALVTRWGKTVDPDNVLPDYPRPQLVRKEWTNLNGKWEYGITDSSALRPGPFTGHILVPYPLESALSGVKMPLWPDQKLWCRRTITLKEKSDATRYLLHFGAVDYQCTVYINGKETGGHTGGYQEFAIDITSALKKGNNEVLIGILDPTDKGNNPKGKQVLVPQGIMYTATSGIWQTVWMETVPQAYIGHLTLMPDIDAGNLAVTATCIAPAGYTVEASANHQIISGHPGESLKLSVPEARLWSPEDPFLYDLSVKLLKNGKVVDEVKSYFGMRKIEVKKDAQGQERIFLNNRYTFNLGVLDQGFWPDGLYTAPTDEALRFDVESIKNMGFNTIRKHIKIEPARWYYHCDRLGMLVWQDMPYPANGTAGAKSEFEKENIANLEQLHNYPSIICWVVFNEGWNRYDQSRLTQWFKKADPSRLVDGHTGENYDRNSPNDPAQKWLSSDMTDIHAYPGPDIPPYLPGKARALGEWGGIHVVTPGHEWDYSKGWGYAESAATEFARQYEFMIRHLKIYEEEGLSAAIFTQPFDVETEENGLVTYDREIFKIPTLKIKAINAILFKK